MDPASALASYFLIDPAITFLNHGSYGATPIPVFERYQYWQRELERQPVLFLGRRYKELMHTARAALAAYLGCDADDLVYVINATTGVNIVARSLDLGPGDEVLTTDHEYGACDRAWRFLAGERGFTYRAATLPYPLTDPAEVVEAIWREVNPRTRLIYLSHLTSPTAVILPVEEICRRARAAGILTLVDGAHAPGQLALNLEALGVDFYTGNLHKWLCAPKGSAFLYARREVQPLLKPLVVSWGYEAVAPGPSRFVDHHEFWGTRDIAAFLATPDAIAFQRDHAWERVSAECRAITREARDRLLALTGQPSHFIGDHWIGQLAGVPLPPGTDVLTLKQRLYDDYKIEIPLPVWSGRPFIRVSVQGYNTRADIDQLVAALGACLQAGR